MLPLPETHGPRLLAPPTGEGRAALMAKLETEIEQLRVALELRLQARADLARAMAH